MQEAGKNTCLVIQAIEAATISANPVHALPVLEHHAHPITAQANRIRGVVPVVSKSIAVAIETIQPATFSTYPQRAITIDMESPDPVVGKRLRIIVTMLIDGDLIAIVALQPLLGAIPQIALLILGDGVDGCFPGIVPAGNL